MFGGPNGGGDCDWEKYDSLYIERWHREDSAFVCNAIARAQAMEMLPSILQDSELMAGLGESVIKMLDNNSIENYIKKYSWAIDVIHASGGADLPPAAERMRTNTLEKFIGVRGNLINEKQRRQ
ncbi:MAG: hypothetical protein FWB96_04605 [Defluviitaleaceae bacterium]|nr:hypothetical protein [Defluviitaleaceae bacterium]MCL2262663.1 hypothetical protein [Defluviitaleaceae bacterium]